ncbi:MAG: CapA family protein [Clostridia bacterium]|nr:CapA family protein [Clostridia bacterium]
MSRRRNRGRGPRIKIVDNDLLNRIIIILIIIIVLFFTIIIGLNKYQEMKIAAEKERIKQQQEEIFKATNEEFESLENYKTNSIIRVSAVGDILCGKNLEQYGKPYSLLFSDIKKYFKNSDLVIGTYETDVKESKKEFVKSLQEAGLNYASIAHNHSLDYGKDGLIETDNYLKGIGIKTVGVYEDSSEKRVKIFEKNDIKIAILAYTYDNGKEGVNIYNEDIIKQDLEYATENASFSIVMMHWGDVNKNEISSQQEQQAKFLIENGADAIIGAHPSVVQKMEVIKNSEGKDCFIGYSLGDFTSDFESENANLELILNLQLFVDTEGNTSLYKVDYTPVYMIDNGRELEEQRFKILDMKAEIADYGIKENSVTEEVYNKLVRAVDRLNGIIIK